MTHIYMTEIMNEKKDGSNNQTSEMYLSLAGASAALVAAGFEYTSKGSDFSTSDHNGKMCFARKQDQGMFDMGLCENQRAYICKIPVND
jgi:hypothetical protein